MNSGWVFFFGVLVINVLGAVALWRNRKSTGWGCIASAGLLGFGVYLGTKLMLPHALTYPLNTPMWWVWGLLLIFLPLIGTYQLGKLIADTPHPSRYKEILQVAQSLWAYNFSIYVVVYAGYVIHNLWPGNLQDYAGKILAMVVSVAVHVTASYLADPLEPTSGP